MSDYNPGDILTISAKSYPDGRRFKVVEANGHRTVLRGAKGAHRVLVCAPDHFGGECSLREDDGERNRGRPCTVVEVETQPATGPLASVKIPGPEPEDPPTWMRARYELGRALGLPAETPWAVCIHEAELARKRATHRPITAMELAMLMQSETPREVAEWVIQRDVTQACVTGDQHAADNGAAMKLYLSSLEIRRLSSEAAS